MRLRNCLVRRRAWGKNLTQKVVAVSLMMMPVGAFGALKAQECGECANPLVQVLDVQLGEDVPDFASWGYHYDKDWESLQGTASQFQRGTAIFMKFKDENPCADLYYMIYDAAQRKDVRVGAGPGDAKYFVETVIWIVREDVQEQKALVKTAWVITVPDPDGLGNIIVDEGRGLGLVDLKGKVFVDHSLRAAKNSRVYDSGTQVWDWVPSPPPDEQTPQGEKSYAYGYAYGEKLEVDGEVYMAEDGLVLGEFSPASLAGEAPHFDKGDIGLTIRKTETPQSCMLDVDDSEEHAPYYHLSLKEITNRFHDPLPGNVRVALRADKGTIENGEVIDGWSVFNTQGAKTVERIKYRPPQCADAKEDKLEIAGVCEFHHGPPTVGSATITKKITNRRCYEATVWMRWAEEEHNRYDFSDPQSSWNRHREIRHLDKHVEAKVTVALEKQYEAPMVMFGEIWEYYQETSANLTSFSHILNKKHYRYGNSGDYGFETTVRTHAHDHGARMNTVELPMTAIVVLNAETKKAKRVVLTQRPIRYTLNTTETTVNVQWDPDAGRTSEDTTEEDSDELVYQADYMTRTVSDPLTGEDLPVEFMVTTGDSVKNLGGGIDSSVTSDSCHWYQQCITRTSFRWGMTRDVDGGGSPVLPERANATQGAKVRIRVYDPRGRLVRECSVKRGGVGNRALLGRLPPGAYLFCCKSRKAGATARRVQIDR